VIKSTFIKNSADYGGGIYNYSSSPTATNCTFSENSADYGGGIENNFNSSPTVTNCIFSGNSANLNGGGMYNYSSPSPTVTNCTFSGNSAEYGGGMSNFNSSPMVTNCTFSGNSATLNGGAMDSYSSSPTVTNCILWGDTPQEIDNRQLSSPVVTYSDVQGGYAGTGNIDTNPLFVGGGDYHLTADSPCIDTGTSSGAPNTDFEGDPRPQGTGYDMGVDEFASCVVSTYYRDFDGDSYGDPNNPKQSCTQPSGYVTNDLDCDDTDPQEHPYQTWYKDVDSDGYSDGTTNTSSCTRPTGYKVASELTATSGDCDDNDQNQNPGAPEVCNGEDDNCNGEIDEGCVFNNPPEANAGSNQTVVEGETVTLDGSNSSDPDGDTISYQWTQIGGILATLSDPTAAKPTFVTPIVSPGGIILTFQLVVKDAEALQDSAQVIITVNDNGIGGFPDDVLTMSSSTGKEIGIKVESGGDCTSIATVDPDTIPDSPGKPENLPYGLFDFKIKTANPGDTVKLIFYLESQAGNDDKWFKYKTSTGVWEDCSAYAAFNAARDQVTLTLVDGGDGDDGPEDGWIVDPSGLSSSASTSTSSGGGGGGGGGCFIDTAADG